MLACIKPPALPGDRQAAGTTWRGAPWGVYLYARVLMKGNTVDNPDTIQVSVEVEREVRACKARLSVEIRGSSFVSGQTALKKAHEVRSLVETLSTVGVAESAIEVTAICAEVASGMISKSSSAVYGLRIEVENLESLASVLGAIMVQKNVALGGVLWRYEGIEAIRDEMLRQALAAAEARAAIICTSLKHRNLGVHSLTEKLGALESAGGWESQSIGEIQFLDSSVRSRAAMKKEDLGLNVSHSKTLVLALEVQYRVELER